eukprot:SAG11_NODE_614_length_8201_cov_3.608121_3_plen_647_part_00
MTESRIASYTNYRFWPEMFASAGLPPDVAAKLGGFRRTHGGEILGTTRFITWLDDWPVQAIALWWLELNQTALGKSSMGSADHYALAMLSHLSHHSSRGTFTAYEQANWADNQADNCVPSQLVVPTMLVHSLVHANAGGDQLWFHRGVPDNWFLSDIDGSVFRVAAVPVRLAGAALVEASTNVTARSNGDVSCTLTVVRRKPSSSATTTCSVRLLPADGRTDDYEVQVNGQPRTTDLDRTHGMIHKVPCVPTETTVLSTLIEVLRPPAPPPHNFPPQPTVPPRCNCSDASDCSFISRPTQRRNVFAYLDNGGPADDPDNWETALNWSVTTHVIRNTHHPLLIAETGDLYLNDAQWPTNGKDTTLCIAHSKAARVLADVDPLGFDAHHSNPAIEEATFLRNQTAVSHAASQIADFITAGGYDGAAFDFEGLSVGAWSLEFEHSVGDGLIRLVKETRAALRAENPDAEVVFAVAANNNQWFNESYRMDAITGARRGIAYGRPSLCRTALCLCAAVCDSSVFFVRHSGTRLHNFDGLRSVAPQHRRGPQQRTPCGGSFAAVVSWRMENPQQQASAWYRLVRLHLQMHGSNPVPTAQQPNLHARSTLASELLGRRRSEWRFSETMLLALGAVLEFRSTPLRRDPGQPRQQ